MDNTKQETTQKLDWQLKCALLVTLLSSTAITVGTYVIGNYSEAGNYHFMVYVITAVLYVILLIAKLIQYKKIDWVIACLTVVAMLSILFKV